MKVGDLIHYDNKVHLLIEIRNVHRDNVEYILLSPCGGFYNLGKHQKSCMKIVQQPCYHGNQNEQTRRTYKKISKTI